MAEPRGPARVPAWHGGDVCIFIFTRIIMVIVHISIRYFGFKLTTIIGSPYIHDRFLSFSLCGIMFPSFRLIAGRVGWHGALDRKRDAVDARATRSKIEHVR